MQRFLLHRLPRLPFSKPFASSLPLLHTPKHAFSTSALALQQKLKLGSIHGSSCSHADSSASNSTESKKQQARMLIGFTCKVCTTRNHKFMSKQAYTKGVVVIKCDGCKNLHLISDHMGWFDTTKKNPGTIEDILKEKGETVQKLSFDPNSIEGSKEEKEQWQAAFANATPEDIKEIEQGMLEWLPSVEEKILK